MSIGKNINKLRTKTGMSASELAQRLGMTEAELLQTEAGERGVRSGDIETLCSIFGVTIDDILSDMQAATGESEGSVAMSVTELHDLLSNCRE